MENYSLPHPSKRDLLIVVDHNLKYFYNHDRESKDKLSKPEILVAAAGDDDYLNKLAVVGGGRFQTDTVYVLSPFDDSMYMELSQAQYFCAFQKLTKTIAFCQLIGAKSVAIEWYRWEAKNSEREGKMNGSGVVFSGEAEVSHQVCKSLKDNIQNVTTFSGGKGSPQDAQKYLSNNRLSGDVALANLLEMRDHQNSAINAMKSYHLKTTLTDAIQTKMEIAAQIKGLVVKLKGSYGSVIEESREIGVDLKLEF